MRRADEQKLVLTNSVRERVLLVIGYSTQLYVIEFAENCKIKSHGENQSQKVDKGGLCLEDRISGLLDDVLVSILSLLTMKEAGRSSLLSKRWRYMWTYITGLNFGASHIKRDRQLEVERPLYLSWVNRVLKSYSGPTLDEFRVQFDFDESCIFDIDNWVNFAIEKRVKRLELDLTQSWEWKEGYNFPKVDCITNHLHSLTNLRLARVNVTGEVLEYFLTKCPFLEELSVKKSNCLVNLKVPDVSLKLKRLEIFYCFNVENIEISAMNLVSFKYFGQKISLSFKNVQVPVEMYIGGQYCNYLIYNFWGILSHLSQLESLALDISFIDKDKVFGKFPVFNKLKKLELGMCSSDNESLIVFAPLIEACPFLCKFVLELRWCDAIRWRKLEMVKSCPHHYLKVVEFIGFVGCAIDVELAMYLIESAVMLEKFTFDSRKPFHIGTPWEFMETNGRKIARKQAEKLGRKLPAGASFVIL